VREQLKQRMTRKQLAVAQRRSSDWYERGSAVPARVAR
jgi:hypothetical protein